MKKALIIFLLLLPLNSYGYWVKTHRKVTENAVAVSNAEQYLFDKLDVQLKVSKFDSKTAWEWMNDGSDWEDDGTRWRSHFYDPTTGLGIGIGEPSVRWAKDYDANEWSWLKARNYYYTALIQTDKTVRENNFAYLFRSLGQIIHLVHDKAVPAHVQA